MTAERIGPAPAPETTFLADFATMSTIGATANGVSSLHPGRPAAREALQPA